MKRISWLFLITLFTIVGCKVNDYQTIQPFASAQDIDIVQQQFADIEDIEVTDDGYITYYKWIKNGYRWRTSVIKSSSNQWACETMIDYLEHGFVIKIGFKGTGGREEHFDYDRCLQKNQ